MSPALDVRFTPLAARHIREAEEWWRENRTAAPNAVREELEQIFEIVALQPRIGARAKSSRFQGVRRIYIPRIGYHAYYHFVGSPGFIEVLALWHARRGSGPPI